jgi:hypothetical protein
MSIPTYFQEINNFGSPYGHPKQADFIAEGLTEIDPATGHLIWNAAGRAVISEIISSRFEQAVELYNFILDLEPKLPDPQTTRQLVARAYYAMFSAGRALSLTLCDRDWGMGKGNHGNLPTHLKIHTRGDSWYPRFHRNLKKWRSLRNCADYNMFPVLIYSGRYAFRRPHRIGADYDHFNDAAFDVINSVERYLRESQRLITARGVHLVRPI